jgi:hypothetical protein
MIRSLGRPAGVAPALAKELCRAQLQKRSHDATVSLKAAPSLAAAAISPRSGNSAFSSAPKDGSTCGIQRLATALTITIVVNNPPAIEIVVK